MASLNSKRKGLEKCIQVIKKYDGKPEWVVIPYDEYVKLLEVIEDIGDKKDIKEYFELCLKIGD